MSFLVGFSGFGIVCSDLKKTTGKVQQVSCIEGRRSVRVWREGKGSMWP